MLGEHRSGFFCFKAGLERVIAEEHISKQSVLHIMLFKVLINFYQLKEIFSICQKPKTFTDSA